MDPNTKPGAGEAPHRGWRNRDYDEGGEETAGSGKRRWIQIVAAVISVFMAAGLLWTGVIQPLVK